MFNFFSIIVFNFETCNSGVSNYFENIIRYYCFAVQIFHGFNLRNYFFSRFFHKPVQK